MTERTIDPEAAIRLVGKFSRIAPEAFSNLLEMRRLELGVMTLEFPPKDEGSPIADRLPASLRNKLLGVSRGQISRWPGEMQADAERVLALLKVIYPDPRTR